MPIFFAYGSSAEQLRPLQGSVILSKRLQTLGKLYITVIKHLLLKLLFRQAHNIAEVQSDSVSDLQYC